MTALEIVRLASDELEVEVLPAVGARLHRVRAFGIDLLRTPSDPATHAGDPWFWGAYPMTPWTNRATAGPMQLAGRRAELVANFPDGTAIHGLASHAAWERSGEGAFRHRRTADRAWPWTFEAALDVAVAGAEMTLRLAVTNGSDTPMPAGLGLHPWFVRPVTVALDARAVHPRNGEPEADEAAPIGPLRLDGGAPPAGLDATWLDLAAPGIRLAWPRTDLRATLAAVTDGPLHAAVATPDDPDATAVEPVTHAPWALDRLAAGAPGAMPLLGPGESLRLDLGLVVARG